MKNFFKFLVGLSIILAAVAAIYYFFLKNDELEDEDFDDFDDFDDFTDEELSDNDSDRDYVSIDPIDEPLTKDDTIED